ncbi:MAG TPA: NADP-dependent oxidoreductase, partial [Burkholderiaceae bacterium]
MHAIVLRQFGSVDHLELAELPTPHAGPGQVLIRIAATGFNPIDYQMRQGLGESKMLASPVLGREFAGTVVALGAGATRFAIGDAVCCYVGSLGSNGTYAEYIAAPEAILAHKPASLDFAQAAALPLAGLTALQCVERLALFAPKSVLVTAGAGGVGAFVLKLLRAETQAALVTTAGNPVSRQQLRELGMADSAIIDYKAGDLTARLLAANGGQPYDAVVELAGGAMSETAVAVLRTHGVYADITNLATQQAREDLFDAGATVLNIANYALALTKSPAALQHYGNKLAELGARIDAGAVSPPPLLVLDGLSA